MSRPNRIQGVRLLPALLILVMFASQPALAEKRYYGLEVSGNLVGYVELESRPGEGDAEGMTVVSASLFAKLTLLGQDFDVKALEEHRIDLATGRVVYYDADITQGSMQLGSSVRFEGNTARFTSKAAGAEPTVVTLDPDVIVDGPMRFPYLIRDLGEGKSREKTYRVYDLNEGKIHEITFTWEGAEELTLAGRSFQCRIYDSVNRTNGATGKVWIDSDTAEAVRSEIGGDTVIYRADPAVVGNIKRAELDDTLFARANVAIADFQSISYMKVKATIRTAGEWVTVESLNVPGQRFEGTVEENFIDGVFEIEHPRYDGASAPAFPTAFQSDPELAKYLEPELMIDSDDPVVARTARKIVEGSKDSWEAACRLSGWVAKEIVYEIPGGSVRQTLDTRKGECSSHSRLLAAFCRAVGIPARQVTGCMYAPLYGGSFGQHSWTEVYMGRAGWIPVDSTANEIDYVDSAHIRLGTRTSFQPDKLEVLDYRPKAKSADAAEHPPSFTQLPWKVGETYTYRYSSGGAPIGTDSFTVKSHEQRDGTGVWTVSTDTDLDALKATGEWSIDDAGTPRQYRVGGKVRGVEYTIECAFRPGEVTEKVVQAGQPVERTVALSGKVYLVDNNNFSLFAFLLSGLTLEQGAVLSLKVFHPSSMQVLPAQVSVKGSERIRIQGREIECRVCELVLAGTPLEMWVDADGRVVKETEGGGRLVVELIESR